MQCAVSHSLEHFKTVKWQFSQLPHMLMPCVLLPFQVVSAVPNVHCVIRSLLLTAVALCSLAWAPGQAPSVMLMTETAAHQPLYLSCLITRVCHRIMRRSKRIISSGKQPYDQVGLQRASVLELSIMFEKRMA